MIHFQQYFFLASHVHKKPNHTRPNAFRNKNDQGKRAKWQKSKKDSTLTKATISVVTTMLHCRYGVVFTPIL